ncbi:hypothetical protein J4Q44_G00129860 [Coregonus suidteri]|uniref:Uncharacterized protein n=1 Tax=Coregonus suidteri TaxID=861788 RepID=A0AAN8QZ26_9TELE
MSKLHRLSVFITEQLSAVAVEIFVVVEKTIAEVQGENDRLRGLLLDHLGADPNQLTLPEDEVPPKQQEWSPRPGQEDPEPTQITEEQEELRTSQEEEKLQRLSKSKQFCSSE